jgi:integrase
MTPRLSSREEALATKLEARLCLRETGKFGKVYHLDFRALEFKVLPYRKRMLRNPRATGWPGSGAPTRDEAEARRWIRPYTREILRDLEVARAQQASASGPVTVVAACDMYLEKLRGKAGYSRRTYHNRRAYFEKLIKPRLGHLPLEALTSDHVEPLLASLTVRKMLEDGSHVTQDASDGTKRFVRGCLAAIWKTVLPGVERPFVGPELGRGNKKLAAQVRAKIEQGRLSEVIAERFRDDLLDNLRRMLVAALWYDRSRISVQTERMNWAVANTAPALACLLSHGLRIDELATLQWQCVVESHGGLIVPGTKSAAAFRPVPLQRQFIPWIALLRDLARPADAPPTWRPHPEDYVFPTRPGQPRRRGSARAIANRISEALRWAGVKRKGEATHFCRKIMATVLQPKLPREPLERYLGHAGAYEEETWDYLLQMLSAIPAAHRDLVDYLPSPDELRAEVETFAPADRPDLMRRMERREQARAAADVATHGGSTAAVEPRVCENRSGEGSTPLHRQLADGRQHDAKQH